jgi:hypothetical protein
VQLYSISSHKFGSSILLHWEGVLEELGWDKREEKGYAFKGAARFESSNIRVLTGWNAWQHHFKSKD